MLILERHREILSVLERDGNVRVGQLAAQFRVTPETIRRDLERLEREGSLQRTHGGALPVDRAKRELSFRRRAPQRQQEKNVIARRALALLADRETIFLDASSTVLQFARAIPDQNLRVVTSSLLAAAELAQRARIRVFLLEGELDASSQAVLGSLTEAALRHYRIDRCFFSCKGIDLERGLSEASMEHARFKQRMLELCEQACLLADHSKFGVRSSFFFSDLASVHRVVTDRPPPEDLAARWKAGGTRLHMGNRQPETVIEPGRTS